jgi:histidyl-tRNA synthetase
LAEQLRTALPSLRLAVNAGGGSFKSQFKKADKSGALFALILGENELAERQVGLKPLRNDNAQEMVAWDQLSARLHDNLQQQTSAHSKSE